MKAIKTNLNLYKSFVEVYETRNFSNAALNLRLTQPTISYNIKELEKQLKVRLFNSNSRGVEPTKNAEELYPVIRQAFVHLMHAENTITEFNEKSDGVVRLNVSLYFMPQITGKLISDFNKKYPNIRFEITSSTLTNGVGAVERHESDMYIYTYIKPTSLKDDLETIDLTETESSFFASKDFLKKHGLNSTISKEQLSSLPILSLPLSYRIMKELEKLGLKVNPIVESNSSQMLMHLATNNVGIILGPDNYITHDLVKLNISDLKIPNVVVAIKYNKDLANKAGSAFIEMVKKQFNK